MAADTKNEAAQNAIYNIVEWTEDIDKGIKELLLLSIEKRSHLAFDMIGWTAAVSKVLFALTNAPACSKRWREALVSNGLGLVSTLSWVGRDRDTVRFVESFQLTEVLFDIAADARSYIGENDSQECYELLMNWAFDAGQHQVGWATLERSTYALVCLALMSDNEAAPTYLKHEYKKRIDEGQIEQELRRRTARSIREKAASLGERYNHSLIERTLSRLDRKSVRKLLSELADILSAPVVQ